MQQGCLTDVLAAVAALRARRQQLQEARTQVAGLQLEAARLHEALQQQDLAVHKAQLAAEEEQGRAGGARQELAGLAAQHEREVESRNRWGARMCLPAKAGAAAPAPAPAPAAGTASSCMVLPLRRPRLPPGPSAPPQHPSLSTADSTACPPTRRRSIADLTAALSAAGAAKLEAQHQAATLRQRVAGLEAELAGRRGALAEALEARQHADEVKAAAKSTLKAMQAKAAEIRSGKVGARPSPGLAEPRAIAMQHPPAAIHHRRPCWASCRLPRPPSHACAERRPPPPALPHR
jgi:hypothetical protein